MSKPALDQLIQELTYRLGRRQMARDISWKYPNSNLGLEGMTKATQEEEAIENLVRQWVKDNPEEVGGDQG